MSAADDTQRSDAGALSFAAGLAIARARKGLLTVREIRAALDEAYRMGQESVRQERTADAPLRRDHAVSTETTVQRCRHCGVEVRTIHFALGPELRHSTYPQRVEAVARALWEACRGEGSGLAWDDKRVSDLYRSRYRKYAAAALTADAALAGQHTTEEEADRG